MWYLKWQPVGPLGGRTKWTVVLSLLSVTWYDFMIILYPCHSLLVLDICLFAYLFVPSSHTHMPHHKLASLLKWKMKFQFYMSKSVLGGAHAIVSHCMIHKNNAQNRKWIVVLYFHRLCVYPGISNSVVHPSEIMKSCVFRKMERIFLIITDDSCT